MPKGPLSRVPWPGNFWMPFTFKPALQALQHPNKHVPPQLTNIPAHSSFSYLTSHSLATEFLRSSTQPH